MPTADKRQRKKENARMAREAREAELKKKRRIRTIRNAAIAGGVFVVAIVLVTWLGGGSKKKTASTTTTTTAAATTTTTTIPPYPPGCIGTAPAASKKPTNLKAPPMTIDPKKTYTASLATSCGDFSIALDAKFAPKSVNNFVYLARQGFFDGLKWHRVAADPPIIQGGDPLGTGLGGPGYTTKVELPPDGKYPVGAVAWAKTGNDPDGSAGSQFFVDVGDASSIGDHYGYIGSVTTGFTAVQKMGSLYVAGTTTGAPARPLYIYKVVITEK